ncbi:BglG family transcription antiterminator [Sporolactobacillus shoreicorticis]|uniref:Ascorbate-specific PTS system EIIA component n=1 Tax=Sporolactobacillus shoreicorticis TaxID=1923877 RepID=A0ABW5RZ68_9BACL|nr:BglG family transcription antiterminator [Sporolactobacillus shoreicorticis]MCO7128078.1 BglG family transcription antiterminator [Sporolactobacillus shoreicorticis]
MIILDREITNLILVQKQLSVEEIADHLSTDKDKIIERIHFISEQLPHESIDVINGEIKISEKCVDELYASLVGNLPSNSNEYEVNLRKSLIKVELIVHNCNYTLQSLSDLFYVSKNTVFSDMKYLKTELRDLNLHVTYSRKEGYQIIGPEYLIRNHLVQLVNELIKTAHGRSCLIDRFNINTCTLSKIRKKLENIEEEILIRLTDEQIENLPFILMILLQRVQNFPKPWKFKVEKFDIRNTLEFPVIKKQFSEFPFLKEVDLLYLSLQILSSNRIESALEFSDSEEINYSVNQFITLLKEKLAIDFIKETDFKSKILLHIQPAIFRNILGFRVNNPLTERFIKEHYYVFKAVAHAAKKSFGKVLEHDFSDEEIVYLSMIVLGWMYQTVEDSSAYYKAVVLCFNGTSVSKLLLENLKDMFPDIDFIGAFSFRQFEQMNLEPDFIFTTVPMKSRMTTIIVPPFLEPDSRKQLRKVVSKLLSQDPHHKAKGIVYAIKDLIPEDKRELAELALKSFFDKKEEKRAIYQERISLAAENISIIDSFVSWDDCVETAFEPIIQRGSIGDDYINRCKSIFYKNYQQMLIGPEVYLPHAPVTGEKADIQLTLFKQAVIDPEDRPFQLIVALVPEKLNAHVPLLLKLNDIFLERGCIEAIVACQSRKNILNLLERR